MQSSAVAGRRELLSLVGNGNCPCRKSFHHIPYYYRSPSSKQQLPTRPLPRRHECKSFSQIASSAEGPRDYAFELANSNVRFGAGVTREIGMDFIDLGVKHVCVFTDPQLAKLSPVHTVLESLKANNIKTTIFDRVQIEPTDKSFREAIDFVRNVGDIDGFAAVGGGSVMDTCKAANLYYCYPPEDFLDYVNPPIGKGLPVPGPLKPLIAVPTTAGTGSETTGVSIFDLTHMKAKTGIAHRRLRPLLGLVDPDNTASLPPQVVAASGFDVLCHSLESYTAIPFDTRPLPTRPLLRPAYQGANPISDVWSLKSLEMTAKWLPRAFDNPKDPEARANMILASTYAGIGFGNAGVHLCHGMSYPVSGLVKSYKPEGYVTNKPLVPHGISVVVHAPAVFRFTAPVNPERHRTVAKLMGCSDSDLSHASDEGVGNILSDQIAKLMKRLNVPNGLSSLGFTNADIPDLVAGALPQHRVIKLSPRYTGEKELYSLFQNSLEVY